jgi:hypothetical protein
MTASALLTPGLDLLFSHWVTPEERATVENGWRQFLKFARQNLDKAETDLAKGDYRLHRIITENEVYISHIGDPRRDWLLEAWIPFWREKGLDQVADALQVRLDEARHEDEEPPMTGRQTPKAKMEPEEEPEDYGMYEDVEEEEEAPLTLRSLIAKTLHHAEFFAKVARG